MKTGIWRAKGRYVLMMNADGQHRSADISRLLEHLPGQDMVVGVLTRELESAKYRDLANLIYNLFASYACEQKIKEQPLVIDFSGYQKS